MTIQRIIHASTSSRKYCCVKLNACPYLQSVNVKTNAMLKEKVVEYYILFIYLFFFRIKAAKLELVSLGSFVITDSVSKPNFQKKRDMSSRMNKD